MVEDLNKKVESENDNKSGSFHIASSADALDDGGFLFSIAAVGCFLMLCNYSDTDMKTLGAFLTTPILGFWAYDVGSNYINKIKQKYRLRA